MENPTRWQEVCDHLYALLTFLTDDSWSITFVEARTIPPNNTVTIAPDIDPSARIALFSGSLRFDVGLCATSSTRRYVSCRLRSRQRVRRRAPGTRRPSLPANSVCRLRRSASIISCKATRSLRSRSEPQVCSSCRSGTAVGDQVEALHFTFTRDQRRLPQRSDFGRADREPGDASDASADSPDVPTCWSRECSTGPRKSSRAVFFFSTKAELCARRCRPRPASS